MSERILIIEDDEHIQLGLKKAFENEGYNVTQAFDGEDGAYLVKEVQPDLIILDIMMPFMNGFEVISELRTEGIDIPILVLSARTETQDKIRGFKLGADDYIEKPFSLEELLARVERRLKMQSKGEFVFGNFSFDQRANLLLRSEKEVLLSGKEIKLLKFFIARKNQILSREQIIHGVWGGDYTGTDRTVDNFILGLRKIIGKEHLVTVRGLGYRFVTSP